MEKVDQDMNNEILLQQCSKLESIEFICLYTNSYRCSIMSRCNVTPAIYKQSTRKT